MEQEAGTTSGHRGPSGAIQVNRSSVSDFQTCGITMLGDTLEAHRATPSACTPRWRVGDPEPRMYVGDCREVLANLPEAGQVDLVFDVQEGADLGPADWALVRLHPDNLAAVDAEAHVPTRENNRVLCGCVANNAFLLALVG